MCKYKRNFRCRLLSNVHTSLRLIIVPMIWVGASGAVGHDLLFPDAAMMLSAADVAERQNAKVVF